MSLKPEKITYDEELYDYSEETQYIMPSLSCTHCWDKSFSPLLEFIKVRLKNYFYPTDYVIERGRDIILIEGILLGTNKLSILVECSGIVFNESYSHVTITKAQSGNYAINKLLEQYIIGKHKLPFDVDMTEYFAHIDSILHDTSYCSLRKI